MLRVVNFLKVLSILLFLVILLLVYAYLPVMTSLTLDNADLQIRKEDFFYFAIGVFVVTNVFFLGFQKMYERHITKLEVKAWVRGLSFIVNIYMTLIIGFIGVINNTAHLDPSGFAYLNYLGPFLIFSWVVGLIYLVKKKS